MEKKGYEVSIHDINIDKDSLINCISNFKPDYIGLSLRNIDDVQIDSSNYFAPILAKTTKEIRKITQAKIILGGSGYSLFPDRLLELSGADFGIWGEGENAFSSLLECLDAKTPYSNIPGLVFRNKENIQINPKKSFNISNIVTAKRPKRLVDFYLEKSSMLNIQTQRGCSYTCCYCTYPVIDGSSFRFRSPESVCLDIAKAKAMGAMYFFITDSVFNSSKRHVTEICEEIIKRKLDIKWGCFLRPKNISSEMMALMKRAGLTHIEFGTDSFCDSVLDAYGKKFTFSDVLEASNMARQAKVYYSHFLIIGGPTETESTILEGYENSKHINKTVFYPFIGMRIYPKTPLYDFVRNEGYIPDNTDFLKPCFYTTPHISKEKMRNMLKRFNSERKNWIVGEITPEVMNAMSGIRKAGVVGPLWEFQIR